MTGFALLVGWLAVVRAQTEPDVGAEPAPEAPLPTSSEAGAQAPADEAALAVPVDVVPEAPAPMASPEPVVPEEASRRRGRPPPPGTPPEYLGMRPAPPYARWPADEEVWFADERACEAHLHAVAPGPMGRSIRRFDAVHRRCEPSGDGWAYREDHAYATLDPVLDPLLLITPPAVLLADLLRRGDSVARVQDRWDLRGDDASLRQPTWRGPERPTPGMAALSDALLGTSIAMSFSPGWMSSGNARRTDVLMMAEVQALSVGIAGSISLRKPEPRPLADADLRGFDDQALWGSFEAMQGDDVFRSTVSVHTSSVAGAGFGLATLSALHRKDASIGSKVAPFVVAAGFTALQGTARVLSLREDPGDVLGGALVGVASGVLVPLSHAAIARTIDPERLRARQARRGGVAVVPTIAPGQLGVAGSF